MFFGMYVFLSILTVGGLIDMEENLLYLCLGKILICLLISFIVFVLMHSFTELCMLEACRWQCCQGWRVGLHWTHTKAL